LAEAGAVVSTNVTARHPACIIAAFADDSDASHAFACLVLAAPLNFAMRAKSG
jgi:hypothetical protein